MDGSTEQPKMTAGLDLGDKYSYLCLLDTESGEVIEESRLPTNPEALLPTLLLEAAATAYSHRGRPSFTLG